MTTPQQPKVSFYHGIHDSKHDLAFSLFGICMWESERGTHSLVQTCIIRANLSSEAFELFHCSVPLFAYHEIPC